MSPVGRNTKKREDATFTPGKSRPGESRVDTLTEASREKVQVKYYEMSREKENT